MFVALGTVFIAYEGTSALLGLYEENGAVDLAYAAERWVSSVSRVVPDYLLLAILAVAVMALALARVGAYLRKRDGGPKKVREAERRRADEPVYKRSAREEH